jgi:hypothetical protein
MAVHMTNLISILLVIYSILNIWIIEYGQYRIVRKFNGYGRFAKRMAGGYTVVYWNDPKINLPAEFLAEWQKTMPLYYAIVAVSLTISGGLLLLINL